MRKEEYRKFCPTHLKGSCPICKAFIGSRCRKGDGSAMKGTHAERVKALTNKRNSIGH